MEGKKEKRITNILIGIGLCVLILFVVITTIVIKFKKQELEDLKDKNDQIKDEQTEDDNTEKKLVLEVDGFIVEYKF